MSTYREDYEDEEPAPAPRGRWILCPVCEGEGTTVNPAIDGNGLTSADFDEDPDFEESYFRGDYDIVCRACDGKRVIREDRMNELERNAQDRRLAALEDGNFEAYCHSRDYRYG